MTVDKPYTTVQHNDYTLTIFHGIVPLDPVNANVDIQAKKSTLTLRTMQRFRRIGPLLVQ